ncbi:amino acid adenylation domain-containing protein [Micromonospora sp. NPDC023814]|uniref:amino acid adenylation domain-containing protein n=1 Tax=Micromonospora sp. NPDC023814 TaxID=3154596 RepID=UPI0033CC0962
MESRKPVERRELLPAGLVDALNGLSRHTACPPYCAVGAGVAVLHRRTEGGRRVGVVLTRAGRRHTHVYDLAAASSMRGLLGSRLADGRDPADIASAGGKGAADDGPADGRDPVDTWLRVDLTDERDDLGVTVRTDDAGADPAGCQAPWTLPALSALLRDAVRRPDAPNGTLSLLDDGTRQRVLEDWNATGRPYPADRTICQLFAEQARSTPLSVAVVDGDVVVTYRELEARANRIANLLVRFGVRPGSVVGLYLPRSAGLVAALLAVLRAGGAYLPLDPGYPPARLRHMLRDSAAALVVSDRAGATSLGHDGRVLLLDSDLATLVAAEPADPPADRARPADLAYLSYTSGSTGAAKGVEVEHRSVVNFLLGMGELLGLDPSDGILWLTSLSFDISVLEVLGPLTHGGRVIVAGAEQTRDGALLARLIHRAGPTVVQATPSTWRVLLDAVTTRLPVTALCGGEPMSPALARRLIAGTRAVWNMYGPTETTVWSTAARIDERNCARPPVGRPVANTRAYVLDAEMQPVPVGCVGELWLGGAGVARGYRRQTGLTAERFVADPFRPGQRLYRTGDLARLDDDGQIELLGRRDQQVKVAGHRVELHEVELALTRLPMIGQAVVKAVESFDGGQELHAFVQLTRPVSGPAELRAHLAAELPSAMLPARIVLRDAFPLLPNGKIDRGALDGEAAPAVPAAPVSLAGGGSALERAVAELWREVLPGRPAVARDDNFFALGGTSLRAAALINRLTQTHAEVFYVTALFKAPTVAGFADYLRREYPRVAAGLVGPEPAVGLEPAVGPEPTPVPQATAVPDTAADTSEADLPVSSAQVARFRRLVTGPAPGASRPVDLSGPAPVFLLSAPRSGSTLLRVMLAGNPDLFVPPELELLGFDSMAERTRALEGPHSYARDGLARAVRELLGGDPREAHDFIERQRDLTIGGLYQLITRLLGHRRLVDKTSTYAMDLSALRRAGRLFPEARYLHLIRHPAAMIASYQEVKLDQVFRHPHDFTPRQLAELIWLVSNLNVAEFFESVPAGRQLRVRFEDLLDDPAEVLRDVARFVGVPFHQAMLDPYADQATRMIDGLYPESRMAGDVKFSGFRQIEKEIAEAWRGRFELGSLSSLTLALGRGYGYPELGTDRQTVRRAPLAVHQRNVYLHQQVADEPALYNICRAWRLRGPVDPLAVRAAGQYLLDRHEALRTVLRSGPDGAYQSVETATDVAFDRLTWADRPDESEVAESLANFAATGLSLTDGPLFRMALATVTAEEHVLAFCVHHSVADGSSMSVLLRDFSTAYAAVLRGCRPELPAPMQYIEAGQRTATPQERERALRHWNERLAGAPDLLALPTDRARPASKRYRGARVPLVLPGQLWQRLTRLARDEDATTFIVALTVFKALLAHYTPDEQEPLVVGTAFVNRPTDAAETVGMFTNTLPLATLVRDDPTFRTLLARVRQTCLDAYEHPAVPFEQLVQHLDRGREVSFSPLVQVLFTFEPPLAQQLRLDGVDVADVEVPWRTSKFDLTLSLAPGDRDVRGYVEFDLDLFDVGQVRRMAEHYLRLAAAVVDDPDQPVSGYEFLTDWEVGAVLRDWNDTHREQPSGPPVEQRIRDHALRQPDAPAVEGDGWRLSYAELVRHADGVARRLAAAGTGAGSVVAVVGDRDPNFVVACLGVLFCGAAYLPVDPDLPPQRVEFMLRDSGAQIVLVGPGRTLAVPDGTRLLCVGAAPAGEASPVPTPTGPQDADTPDRSDTALRAENDLAYVIYTSGSTGHPKGVMIERRSLTNFVDWYVQRFGLTSRDRCGQTANVGFDVCAMDVWPTLAAGATLVIAPGTALTDPAGMWQWQRDSATTVSFLVTPLFEAMLNEEMPAGLALRTVVVAGDRLHAHPALAGLPFEVVNGYGPTENTILSTIEVVLPEHASTRPPIGRPIANTTAYVLDQRRRPVPVGVAGELYLGGAQVARGYLNRPELTRERFLPDPFRSGGWMFRTGDRVRHRADGSIEFIGRIDHQVKIRGFRIELGEIEAALEQVPMVKDAVVLAVGEGHQCRLRAFYLADDEIGAPLFRDELRRTLPSYMIPADFVRVDTVPVTANGKVDRRALAALPVGATTDAEPVTPASEVETRLLVLWRRVLGDERIQVTDSFFDAGGHSLSAMRLVSLLCAETGRDVSLGTLFNAPSVRELVRHLDGQPSREATGGLVPIQPAGSLSPLVCVPASDGSLLPYQRLRDVCAPKQPVWGLRVTGSPDRDTDVETLADRYAELLTASPLAHPLRLLGWSFGGLLAFATAGRLAATGRPPAGVVLLDAEVLTGPVDGDGDLLLREFHWQLRRRSGRHPEVGRNTRPESRITWSDVVDEATRQGLLDDGDGERTLREAFDTFSVYLAMGRRHTPQPITVPVTLYVVADRAPERRDRQVARWRELTGGRLTVRELPGDHMDAVGDHALRTVIADLAADVVARPGQEA